MGGDAICKPLEMIFNEALVSVSFPSNWEKANIVLIHKNGGTQTLKNYIQSLCSLFLVKSSKGLFLNKFLDFFLIINELQQTGFRPGDSCINKLLSITNEIHKSFDDGP